MRYTHAYASEVEDSRWENEVSAWSNAIQLGKMEFSNSIFLVMNDASKRLNYISFTFILCILFFFLSVFHSFTSGSTILSSIPLLLARRTLSLLFQFFIFSPLYFGNVLQFNTQITSNCFRISAKFDAISHVGRSYFFIRRWIDRVPYADACAMECSPASIGDLQSYLSIFAHDDSVLFTYRKRFILCYIHKCLVSFSAHIFV